MKHEPGLRVAMVAHTLQQLKAYVPKALSSGSKVVYTLYRL